MVVVVVVRREKGRMVLVSMTTTWDPHHVITPLLTDIERITPIYPRGE